MKQQPDPLCTVSPFAEQGPAAEYLKVSNQMANYEDHHTYPTNAEIRSAVIADAKAEDAVSRLLVRLESAIRLSARSDDYGVGYRTGLRMAMDIAEGVQHELRTSADVS